MAEECLFHYVEKLQGPRPWGSVLDAGTGEHSLSWVSSLETERWTAVTADPARVQRLREKFAGRMRAVDQVVEGSWSDPAFLYGEVFDVVLADYLLGAVDAFTPYLQYRLFERLRPHVGERLYTIGLNPYVESDESPAARVVREIARLRDACILLAGHRPNREYPLDWVLRALESSGYGVEEVRVFPILYGKSFIDGQLGVCSSKLRFFKDAALAARMETTIAELKERAIAVCENQGGLPFGEDYVVYARSRGGGSVPEGFDRAEG